MLDLLILAVLGALSVWIGSMAQEHGLWLLPFYTEPV
jgi:hypothetical protein